ncbi:MAG: endonuclease/exonuclease/phosphatase family protein [Candidatus Eremiobacteraeota bacterium]|nr:endonuclease/exonuclease/phosphatase family protein [Candidatus Eremiobacteraeota bacterium]
MDVQRLRIGSYNVKDFIAPSQGGGVRQAKSNQELRALAQTIKEADCDVVALQEVGSKSLLEKFVKERLNGSYEHVALVPSNDRSGLNLALISKYPITKVVSHKNDRIPTLDGQGTTQFTRDFLRTDVDVNGETVTVYNTHGKARMGDVATESQRIAEAKAGREILLQDMKPFPSRLVVVTGDMNDETHNRSVQTLAKGQGDGMQLVDSLADKPREEQLTWIIPSMDPNANRGLQFDHVLYPAGQKEKFVGSQVHSKAKGADQASDHYLVSADFNISKSNSS